VLKDLPLATDPNVIVGQALADDAGVYRLTGEIALVQTVDFFTPIVNNPYDFGRVAAANAFSDVYAMGGRPLTVMNIVCFPVAELEKWILKEILRGGLDKIEEAGAALVGGHSVDDAELKYGLSVTGVVSPDKVWTNAGAQPGDVLLLTKPLGTGILATAIKAGLLSSESERRVTEVMATLNKRAAEVLSAYPVHGCTDVTGFGLLGHALEMARASRVTLSIDVGEVPLLPEVVEYAGMGLVPAGSYANRNFCADRVQQVGSIDPLRLDVIADAQTSGGLFVSLPADAGARALEDLRAAGVSEAKMVGTVDSRSHGLIKMR
jgi:selenide,water dikinase